VDSQKITTAAGRYPTAEGSPGDWDGFLWVPHLAPPTGREASGDAVAPSPVAERPGPRPGRRVIRGPARLLGWAGLCLLAVLGAASFGVTGLLALSAIYLYALALVAISGHECRGSGRAPARRGTGPRRRHGGHHRRPGHR
jgi:hypothetical protein